jgi:hypothetical protein
MRFEIGARVLYSMEAEDADAAENMVLNLITPLEGARIEFLSISPMPNEGEL